MTDPVMLTVWGLLATFVLVFLHVPVGVAMGLAGVTGFGLMAGFDPAFAMIASETSNALSSLDLVTIPLFVLMGSFASLAGLSEDLYRWPRRPPSPAWRCLRCAATATATASPPVRWPPVARWAS